MTTHSIDVYDFIKLKFNDSNNQNRFLVNMYDYCPRMNGEVNAAIMASSAKHCEVYMYNINEDVFNKDFGNYRNVYLTR